MPKEIIGWKDFIDLPEFGLKEVPVKIDTGARTSVLHCSHIRLLERPSGTMVEFIPLGPEQGSNQVYELPFVTERLIKNSFGQEENRYIVTTKIRLFGREYDIELSLRDRSGMEFPMLLGRSFVRGKFLVDASKSFVSNKKSKKS